MTIDAQSGELLAGPDLISRGFVHIDESRELLEDATDRVQEALEALEAEELRLLAVGCCGRLLPEVEDRLVRLRAEGAELAPWVTRVPARV